MEYSNKQHFSLSGSRQSFFSLTGKSASTCALILSFSLKIFAQSGSSAASDSSNSLYIILGVAGLALIVVAVLMMQKKKNSNDSAAKSDTTTKRGAKVKQASASSRESSSADSVQKGFKEAKTSLSALPVSDKFNSVVDFKRENGKFAQSSNFVGNDSDKAPVNDIVFKQIKAPATYTPLPSTNDDAVLDAIEQLREDENDEAMRSLALRILSTSKTQEGVEGLQLVALSDSSAQRRAEAVIALGALDHESGFETILRACADPSREVRAAAAKTLTRLSFDRADAFARIIFSHDDERILLATLACLESGFAARAFERISAQDPKQAYEAYVILNLLVKSGDSEPIMNTIAEHPNMQVRLSTIKFLQNCEFSKFLPELSELSQKADLPEEVKNALRELTAETRVAA